MKLLSARVVNACYATGAEVEAGHAMAMNDGTKMPDGTECTSEGDKHADDTYDPRLLMIKSETPSELIWYYKQPNVREPIKIAVANYPAGLVMACMNEVNNRFSRDMVSSIRQ